MLNFNQDQITFLFCQKLPLYLNGKLCCVWIRAIGIGGWYYQWVEAKVRLHPFWEIWVWLNTHEEFSFHFHLSFLVLFSGNKHHSFVSFKGVKALATLHKFTWIIYRKPSHVTVFIWSKSQPLSPLRLPKGNTAPCQMCLSSRKAMNTRQFVAYQTIGLHTNHVQCTVRGSINFLFLLLPYSCKTRWFSSSLKDVTDGWWTAFS